MEEERMTFTLKDQDGKDVECDVLFTFESEETKKNYMVYTDNTQDKDGNTRVYAAIYTPNAKTTVLEPIETEKEWKIIQTIIDELQSEIEEEGNEPV